MELMHLYDTAGHYMSSKHMRSPMQSAKVQLALLQPKAGHKHCVAPALTRPQTLYAYNIYQQKYDADEVHCCSAS